jgi:abortive infection bacteriophage resistance protein
LYTLFLFDRELRSLFLRRLLEVEAHMRTAIAYRASEHFSDDAEFYLDPLSYSGRPEDAERVGTLIEKLQKNREADTASLSHYRKTHGEVPFWVLVNYVTFGTLSYFYKLIKPRGIQQRVVNDLKSFYLSQRGRKARFTVERLTRDLWVLVDFRNACAHDERLYNHICKRINTNPEEPANVAYLLNILNQYLDADSSDTMTSDLIGLIDSLADREGLSRNTVLRVMLAIGLKIEPQG